MRVLAIFILMLSLGSAGCRAEPVSITYHAGEICIPVQLHKASGETVSLSLELAVTPQTMKRGLMFRSWLPPFGGMLFVFSPPQEISMWMKNTLIPLDMLFVSAENEIISIQRNAVPHDLTPLPSRGKVLYVIELNGGAAARYGIQPGDEISLPNGLFDFK